MRSEHRTVVSVLTYLGALPFWLLTLAAIFAPQIDAKRLFVAYGAIIASFMAGTLWGSVLGGRPDIFIILSSNVLALVAFATLVIGHSSLSLLTQMILFGLLLAADARILAEHYTHWYLKLRVRVTLVALLAYCLMFVSRLSGI